LPSSAHACARGSHSWPAWPAGRRAKNIRNKPRINEDPKDAMLREFQEEIKRLKEQLEVG
jgi:hypothetical protein